MSININNVKVVSETYQQRLASNQALANIVKCMQSYGIKDPLQLLPSAPNESIEFELHNSYAALANGLRRCLLGEIVTVSLTFASTAWQTNDTALLIDQVQRNVEMCTYYQPKNIDEKSEMESYTFKLDVVNKTDDVMPVTIGDVKAFKGKDAIDTKKWCVYPNIVIAYLHQGYELHIKDFIVEYGLCQDNAAKFTLVDCVKYEILGVDAYDTYARTGKSSTCYVPKDFKIKVITKSNCPPKQLMIKACETLMKRIAAMQQLVKAYKAANTPEFSVEFLEVIPKSNCFEFHFKNEYITTVSILAYKCFQIDETIPYVAHAIVNPSIDIGILKINHNDYINVLLKACDESLKDLIAVRKAFA